MLKCSVVVLSYNSNVEQMLLTLESIVKQKEIDLDIIIADDGSEHFCEKEIRLFFEIIGFSSYIILINKENQGTVKNVYNALLKCNGEFVKLIGAGDLLFQSHTLYKMCKAMKSSGCVMGFGLMKKYSIINNSIESEVVVLPNNLCAFQKKNTREIYNMIIKYEQCITGVSVIYNTKEIIPLLKKLVNKVIYCEDLVVALIVLENKGIEFIPLHAVWYENGAGLSSRKSGNVSMKIVSDQIELYKLTNKVEKNPWREMGKKIIHKEKNKQIRSLYKILFEPGMIFIVLKTQLQKRKGVYSIDEKGFLNEEEFINEYHLISEQIKAGG